MTGQRISDATRRAIADAWQSILDGIAAGGLVRDVLARHGVSRDALRCVLATEPGTREQWEQAREASADALFDAALETAYNTELEPAHARTRVDTLKWAARIRNPKLYGDRSQLDVNVKTVDLTRIIQDANARLIASRQTPVIDLPADQFERLL